MSNSPINNHSEVFMLHKYFSLLKYLRSIFFVFDSLVVFKNIYIRMFVCVCLFLNPTLYIFITEEFFKHTVVSKKTYLVLSCVVL